MQETNGTSIDRLESCSFLLFVDLFDLVNIELAGEPGDIGLTFASFFSTGGP